MLRTQLSYPLDDEESFGVLLSAALDCLGVAWTLYPWSAFLSGTSGRIRTHDPLDVSEVL
jgi:hypothetical protein